MTTLNNTLRPQGIAMNNILRFRANVGATIDIPTGKWVEGLHGESIINGGVPLYIGISGKANNFKSTIMDWIIATILFRYTHMQSSCTKYDTEVTTDLLRMAYLYSLMEGFESFQEDPMELYRTGYLTVTDKSMMSGNKWWEGICTFLNQKTKDRSILKETEIKDLHGQAMKFLIPTVSAIDSISEFETDDVLEMRHKSEIGQKEGNMINMRQGLGKDRLIREVAGVSSQGNHFMLMTAQWGEEKPDLNASPMSGPKPKKMNTIKQGEKIRGVPDSFLYLPQHVWLINGSENLKDDSKTNAEFPLDMESTTENLDLWRCPMTMLRSKTGISAFNLDIIVSQKRGVQPTLTEFFHIFRKKKRYGIEGAGQFYTLDLYPDLKLQRTEVRKKIDSDPLLRRAINLTSELAQIADFDPDWSGKVPPLKEVRKKLESDGYNWNKLLATRGWFTFQEYAKQLPPFLSSMDILKMFYGEYKPYWYKD